MANASCSGKMHHWGQSAESSQGRGTYSLHWDGDSKEPSLDHRCQHGTAVLAVACPFCGTKEKSEVRQNPDDTVDDGWPVGYRVPASEIPEDLSENSTWDSDVCPVFALHSPNARTLKENKPMGPKRGKFPNSRNLLTCSGVVSRKPFCRSSRQRGSASQMIGCQFPGGDRTGELYGFTWTLASPVTS
jgi:hypothetical protein